MNVPADALAINPQCRVTTEFVGQGHHKLVMADHFYQHPEKALELALGSKKSAQALGAPGKIQKGLITREVTRLFVFHHAHQYLTRLF